MLDWIAARFGVAIAGEWLKVLFDERPDSQTEA